MFRTDNDGENEADGKDIDIVKDGEEKEMKKNLDIDELYDTLKSDNTNNNNNKNSKSANNNGALKPQDSKTDGNKEKKEEPAVFDRSTVKDAEEQSNVLATAWLKRHLNKPFSNFKHIHESYTPGLFSSSSGKTQAENIAYLSEMKTLQDHCQNCNTGNLATNASGQQIAIKRFSAMRKNNMYKFMLESKFIASSRKFSKKYK